MAAEITYQQGYIKGQQFTLTKISDMHDMSCYGYHLSCWSTQDGSHTFQDGQRDVILTSDTEDVYAIWEKNQYTIIVSASDETMGQVYGGGTFPYKDKTTISATSNRGCRFLKWESEGTYSEHNPIEITVSSNQTFTANFERVVYRIDRTISNCTLIDEPSTDSIVSGYPYTATVVLDDGYRKDTFRCTMGDAEIPFEGDELSIEYATGNISISAIAEEEDILKTSEGEYIITDDESKLLYCK